jgi:hypothetical protein
LFVHCLAPGVQTPVHAPETHAWLTQTAAVPHWPVLSHVWIALPEQRVAPGAQTPVQAPAEQA